MKIDIDSIAKGLFDMMPYDDQRVVACGMIPKNWLDMTVENFKKTVVRKQKQECSALLESGEISPDQFEFAMTVHLASEEVLIGALNKSFISGFEKDLSIRILKIGCRL